MTNLKFREVNAVLDAEVTISMFWTHTCYLKKFSNPYMFLFLCQFSYPPVFLFICLMSPGRIRRERNMDWYTEAGEKESGKLEERN